MPRGDRTGPRGMGSMTGRSAGYCAGYGMPGAGRGIGMGYGRGGGRGWRNGFGAAGGPGFGMPAAPYQQPEPEAEKQSLKNQAEMLEMEMKNIKRRLDEMDAEGQEK